MHIFTWKSRARASLIRSIHASTFTPFTRIMATKVKRVKSQTQRGRWQLCNFGKGVGKRKPDGDKGGIAEELGEEILWAVDLLF